MNIKHEKLNYSTNKAQVNYMIIWECVHTLVTVFLPNHCLVTSILLSCHNQISLTTQIPWPFPDFGPFPWLFSDLSQIPWHFHVSRIPEVVTMFLEYELFPFSAVHSELRRPWINKCSPLSVMYQSCSNPNSTKAAFRCLLKTFLFARY